MKNLYDSKDWSDIQVHQKIGEILMQSGKLDLVKLGIALDIQKFKDLQLGEILVGMKEINNTDINQALIVQKEIDKNIKEGVFK